MLMLFFYFFFYFTISESGKGSNIKKGVAVALWARETNTASGAKAEEAKAERNEVAAQTEKAGIAGAHLTRNAG